METSEISMGGGTSWAPFLLTIQGNGPLGIFEEFGSQVTVIGGTQILDHTTAGIDVYGNSQVSIADGSNQITHNGFGLDAARAGIRVDGGSQVYMRNATIARNGGPGVLGLVNSSLDIANSSFSSNAGGAGGLGWFGGPCHRLASGNTRGGQLLQGPRQFGGQARQFRKLPGPGLRHRQKAAADKMHAMVSAFRK